MKESMIHTTLLDLFIPLLWMMQIMGYYFNIDLNLNRGTAVQKTRASRECTKMCCALCSGQTEVVSIKISPGTSEEGKTPSTGRYLDQSQDVDLGSDSLNTRMSSDVKSHRWAKEKRGKMRTWLRRAHGLVHLLATVYLTLQTGSTICINHDFMEGITPIRIVTVTWMIHCSLNCVIFFRASVSNWLPSTFQEISDFCEVCASHGLDLASVNAHTKRFMYKVTCLPVVLVVFMACVPNVLFFVVPLGREYVRSMIAPFETSDFALYLLMTANCLTFLFWSLVAAFVSGLTRCLAKLFQNLADLIEHKLSAGEEVCVRLPAYRDLYLRLARIVELVDRHVGPCIAASYLVSVTVVLIIGYAFVKSRFGLGMGLLLVPWLLVQLFFVLVTSLPCCCLHDQAKAPLQTLFRVQSASKNPQHAAELNLFIQTIIHGNVGITVMDLFVITKSTILTIVSVVVSYFFVIIQLNI